MHNVSVQIFLLSAIFMVMASLWYKKCVYMDFRLAAYVYTTLCWSSDKLRGLLVALQLLAFVFLSVLLVWLFLGVKSRQQVVEWRPYDQIQLFACSPPTQRWSVCFIVCLRHRWRCKPVLSLSWLLGGSLQCAARTDSSLALALFIYLSICLWYGS